MFLTDWEVTDVIEEDIVAVIGAEVSPVAVVGVLVWLGGVLLVVSCCWVYSTMSPDRLRLNKALRHIVTHLTALAGSTLKMTLR